MSKDDPVIVELVGGWGLGEEACRLMTSDTTSVTDGRRKLVRRGDSWTTYDLVADPDEAAPTTVVDPLAHSPEVAALFRSMLEADATDADPEAIAAIVAANAEEATSPELEQQLKLLGYI
jgi:hypothetical protein